MGREASQNDPLLTPELSSLLVKGEGTSQILC